MEKGNKIVVSSIISILEECYPQATCTLEYENDYELLFAARLAAQCTDERVNTVAPILFSRFPTLELIAGASREEVEGIIRPCGFYRAKARDIIAAAVVLIGRFNSRVPDTMEDLLTLPGVGRKTANLMLGDVHGKPAVVVDTHCIRLSNRIGLVNIRKPEKIEEELKSILPPEKSSDFCHRLVLHGRSVCTARNPICGDCCIALHCKKILLVHDIPG